MDFAVEIAEDDRHVKVLQMETDALQVDDFDIARSEHERRELREFDQARRRGQNAHRGLVRHPLECELVVRRVKLQIQLREILFPNFLHALGKVAKLLLDFLLTLALALFVFDFIRVVHVTTPAV